MKRIFLAIILGIILSNLAFAQVNSDDLENISKLVKSEQYELALQKHLWFHEESKSSAGMAGVRLSYALSDWLRLGEKYPPALDELRRVRNNNKEKIYSGLANFNNVHDFKAINRTLGEDVKTIEMFHMLHERFPDQASKYYFLVENLLIEEKEFELVEQYMDDPIFKYETIRYQRERSLSYARTKQRFSSQKPVEYANNLFVNETVELINALLIIEREKDAIEIHHRAMAYFKSQKIEDALVLRR